MNPRLKHTVRVADGIRDQLLGLRQRELSGRLHCLSHFLGRYGRLCRLDESLRACVQHHHFSAAEVLQDRLRDGLQDITYDLGDMQRLFGPESRQSAEVPTLRVMFDELQQLQSEFGEWKHQASDEDDSGTRRRGPILSVQTEAIELEGVYLGEFEIRLRLDAIAELGRSAPYEVYALDPHPATTNDAVTHPHVSDERLCEGDASGAIRAALRQGRLCDFFLLVRSVLQTYNPDSPYVKLEHWNGESCHDCGDIMNDDGHYSCEACDDNFCSECISYCRCCDTSMCCGCLDECRCCDERVCSSCLKRCADCGRSCCQSCLEDDTCPDCQTKPSEENPDATPQAQPDLIPASASANLCAASGNPAPSTGASDSPHTPVITSGTDIPTEPVSANNNQAA